MTREVATCRCETTNEEIMRLMTNGRFHHMPVCENGKLVGIYSPKSRFVQPEAGLRCVSTCLAYWPEKLCDKPPTATSGQARGGNGYSLRGPEYALRMTASLSALARSWIACTRCVRACSRRA